MLLALLDMCVHRLCLYRSSFDCLHGLLHVALCAQLFHKCVPTQSLSDMWITIGGHCWRAFKLSGMHGVLPSSTVQWSNAFDTAPWAGQVKYIGYFDGEEEAARAYDTAMLALRGNSAQTNFAAAEYTGEAIAKAEDAVWGQRQHRVLLCAC